MLSILIPTYNYDVYPLIIELESQASKLNIVFEIICIDDCSDKIELKKDEALNLKNTNFILLQKNIGRSAIRNLLAQKANYDDLIFVDAGTFPKSKYFIKKYLDYTMNEVVLGGMVPEEVSPKKPFKLRWLYTGERERLFKNGKNQRTLTSSNFFIKKEFILKYPFNENIVRYGYEDYLFFNNLRLNKIKLQFINNPVIHDSKEDANTFLKNRR